MSRAVLVSRRRLLLALPFVLPAQEVELRGTWSATTGGRRMGGTWTALVHSEPDAGWGKWVLRDASGNALASGTWSARKAARAWRGAWQAWAGNDRTVAGEWTASTEIPPSSSFSDLLRSAVTEAVGGNWYAAGLSGTWTIHTRAGK